MAVSFVLPAYNEERFIGRSLRSIHEHMAGRWRYEVIVVDNGSSDRTVEHAKANGAKVLGVRGATIAQLRNEGAASSSGEVLVFLDADVLLTPAWADTIANTLEELHNQPRLVTGSACGVPDNGSWLEKRWFGPLQNGRSAHINSGHLVINASFFKELGGFDKAMETGEDYDLSMRALSAGGRLESNSQLAVVHLGYPQSVRAFVRREAWHGRGDFVSLSSIARSPVALATVIFLTLHLILLITAATTFWLGAIVALGGIIALCVAASVRQFSGSPWPLIAGNGAIYYLYFWGRAFALASVMFKRRAYVHRDRR